MSKTGVLAGVILVLLAVCLVSAQGRKVSGFVVTAATGRPVPNANVRYEEAGSPPETTTTDAKGYFEFPAGGLGVVTATARSFGTASRRWPPPQGARLRIALTAPAIVEGTVKEQVTGGFLEAIVTVTVQHADYTVSDTAVARDGVFTIKDLPSGNGILLARAPGFAPFVGSLIVEGGKRRFARVRLSWEGTAAGRVLESDGSPATGALVEVAYPGMAGGGLVQGFAGGQRVTGSDGRFLVSGLVPETLISFQATLGGRRSAPVRITVGSGMMQPGIELQLP